MTRARPNIVIVGGGIGGLFVANALVTTVLRWRFTSKRPPSVRSEPGCISHQTVCATCSALDWDRPSTSGVPRSARILATFHHEGSFIAPVQVTDSMGWNATYGIHRADLVEILAKALPAGVVHTGHRCIGFEQNGGVCRVSFANGAVVEGDAVIGADGIHSEVRQYVFCRLVPFSPVRSPTVVSCERNSFPNGPASAGRCGLAKASTS
jgi:salicylate hydroxylase